MVATASAPAQTLPTIPDGSNRVRGVVAKPTLIDTLPPKSDQTDTELIQGLLAQEARISPKYFYDTLGSKLFEAICALPEYDLTRAEARLLDTHIDAMAATIPPGCTLIDLGAGNCAKAERLFAKLRPAQYVAVDISADYLFEQLKALAQRHPHIPMVGLAQDFTHTLALPELVRPENRVFMYLGSSIGNFAPPAAGRLFTDIRAHCGHDGQLLLGIDLVKAPEHMQTAYDDCLGVTAAFNRNVLHHVNARIQTRFDPRDWRHIALYNEPESRIEMHLEALRDIEVHLGTTLRTFHAGERICTEHSYKYRIPMMHALLESSFMPFAEIKTYTDQRYACLQVRCLQHRGSRNEATAD